jgi:acyl-CoA reductase-like NAD-dependent aldehyde dehydrogenase
LWTALWISQENTSWATRSTPDQPGPDGAHLRRRVRARPDRRRGEGRRQGAGRPKSFAADKPGTPYWRRKVLVNVDHAMSVMSEESFGPVIGIMKVKSDDEAIRLMKRQQIRPHLRAVDLGSPARRKKIGDRLETGTIYM